GEGEDLDAGEGEGLGEAEGEGEDLDAGEGEGEGAEAAMPLRIGEATITTASNIRRMVPPSLLQEPNKVKLSWHARICQVTP
ncbi:MAG: hypothetical protein ACRDJK_00680, partial [Actinomycetota bacterium]